MKKELLVVVDMQNDFIDGSLGTKEAESLISDMAHYISSWDGPIVFKGYTWKGLLKYA